MKNEIEHPFTTIPNEIHPTLRVFGGYCPLRKF